MKYIKIDNFYNQFGQPNYKGLDINQNVPFSQIYPENSTYTVLATNQDIITLPQDIEEITQEQYLQEKSNIETANKQPSQNADLTNQIQTLSQTVAQMQLN